MFGGMSSAKEYLKRAHSAPLVFETTSLDNCLFDDSNSSSSKECRDASCNVDFDDDTDELIDENLPNVSNRLTQNPGELTVSKSHENTNKELTRYVRWNVLMSLGIGLWAVLCIVDLFHSEKFVYRDWFYESIWGKKIVKEPELPKKVDIPIQWYTNLWPYLWKIVTITTSGGAYVLLFLLMIVFCIDPRLRNCSASSKNVVAPNNCSSVARKNSLIKKKSLVIGKKSLPRNFARTKIPKFVSVRLELAPSLNLQRKIVLFIEKSVQADFTKFDYLPSSKGAARSETRLMKIFDDTNNRGNERGARSSVKRRRNELADSRSSTTLRFSSPNHIDWSPIKKIDTIFRDSDSLYSIEATSRSDLNFNASTFDLEIGEYGRETPRASGNVLHENSCEKIYEGRKEFGYCRPGFSNFGKTKKTRIITSSPAFKKFLSSLQQNSGVS